MIMPGVANTFVFVATKHTPYFISRTLFIAVHVILQALLYGLIYLLNIIIFYLGISFQ